MTDTVSSGRLPTSAFTFVLRFGAANAPIDCAFSEVSGVSTPLSTEAAVAGGENQYVHALPKAAKQGPLRLKRGVASRNSELASWCSEVLEGSLPGAMVTKTIAVTLQDEHRRTLMTWVFVDAYPVHWQMQPVSRPGDDLAIEQVVLSFASCTRVT